MIPERYHLRPQYRMRARLDVTYAETTADLGSALHSFDGNEERLP